MFDRVAIVNLNREPNIENIDDKEFENKILEQIQLHRSNSKVKKRWEILKLLSMIMYLIYQTKIFVVILISSNIYLDACSTAMPIYCG